MSKFNYENMSNDESECVCFNKEKWTKEKALEQAKFELNIDINEELEIVEGFVKHGYFRNSDGEVDNCWYCEDIYGTSNRTKAKNEVPVWIISRKEDESLE